MPNPFKPGDRVKYIMARTVPAKWVLATVVKPAGSAHASIRTDTPLRRGGHMVRATVVSVKNLRRISNEG